MQPYFDDGRIRIYHAPWENVWAALGLKHEDVALLWADPPYGMKSVQQRGGLMRKGVSARRSYPPVVGDDSEFDPSPLLAFSRSVLWGANYYAHHLPASPSWWMWDKKGQEWECDQADGELAWTTLGGVLRVARLPWLGGARGDEGYHHPTQKPVALATWGFQRAKLKPGDLVFSPYMGSGPEARAALDMGLRFIGCEIVEEYCRAAVNRLRQLPLL